jgi:hypothetical protein
MRRHAYQLAAVLLLAALGPGCGGGGYGFQSNNNAGSIDGIVFSNGSGQTNVFAVSPTGPSAGPGAPGPLIQINATGVRGSLKTLVPDTSFTWDAAFNLDTAVMYTSNAAGLKKQCGLPVPTSGITLPDISPFSSTPVLYYQAPGGGYAPLAPDQIVSTVYVTPPIGVTDAVGYTNYCIIVTAVGDGATATLPVVVTNTL